MSAAGQQTTKTKVGTNGGTVAGGMLTLVALACAVGGYVWHDHRSKQQQQQARDAVLGGGEVLEMVDNPLRGGGGARAGAGAGAGAVDGAVDGASDGDGDDAGAGDGAPIYDPPAFVPPSQEFPTYYSDVSAAAPETAAEYAAPNALPSSAVYNSGQDGGAVDAAYTALDNGGAVYGGRAVVYAIPSEHGGASLYAATGMDRGMDDDGALYTNDAYGNVAGNTI